MRRPFTRAEALTRGQTDESLKCAVKAGRAQRVFQGIYIAGPEPITPIERALALVIATDGVASHSLAGVLQKLDSVQLTEPFATVWRPTRLASADVRIRRLDLKRLTLIDGYRCTNGLQTMLDLATVLDDLRWEQALESALRKRLVTIQELGTIRDVQGTKRIRRVLALRPPNVPPTESVLETLTVQLIRTEPLLPTPARQVVVLNKWERFVARVDLAWPDHGIFLELDGQHHKDQPVYDANRQTAVVAAKAWLPGRFTWHEVTCNPKSTLWRLMELFEQASQLRRPA